MEICCLHIGQFVSGPKNEDKWHHLEAFCASMGWEVRVTSYGSAQNAVETAQSCGCSIIVCESLTEISPTGTKELIGTLKVLKGLGVHLVSILDVFDSGSPTGKMLLNNLDSIITFETSILGSVNQFQPGLHGAVPYGYQYDKTGKQFLIHPNEAKELVYIFEEYAAGTPAYTIATTLNARGVPTKRKGKWQTTTIHQVIDNFFYTGKAKWEGVIIKSTHPSLVSDFLFQKAQAQRERNRKAAPSTKFKFPNYGKSHF